MSRRPRGLVVGLSGLGLLAGCSDPAPAPTDASTVADVAADAPTVDVGDAPSTPKVRDLPDLPVSESAVVEAGVRRERFFVDAPAPPSNPTTGAATPAMFNRVPVMRYRVDVTPAVAVRAVVVAMPGFLGGAGSFDPLARSLVKRASTDGAPVEVWVIDRRANLLEDLRGMNAADRLRDPEVAAGYYNDQSVTIGGAAFAGYRTANDAALSFMSEWGLATTLGDLRAVIARVPQSREHAVLVGHSLGATIAESYAAWDFDGAGGYRSIAGLVVLDGVAGGTAASESEWRSGSMGGPFGSTAGVDALRRSGPYFTSLPILGVGALATSEIVARRAALSPSAVVADPSRDRVLRLLFSLTAVPPLTNAAAMGLAFDDGSCPLAFARMSMGQPTGGPLRRVTNPFATTEQLTVPSGRTETYSWTDAPMSTPPEFTPLANAASAWATTPTNFGEWYFPTRLSLDTSIVGNLRLAADSWQVREGIRATHGAEVDVPVLAIAAALVGRASAFEGMRARLSPTVGADLPAAGSDRMSERGFRSLFVPGMTHLDPITGADDGVRNPVPGLVAAFVRDNTRGTIAPAP
jgi:pimeloyl-ACP methyl ester carboxylesterase